MGNKSYFSQALDCLGDRVDRITGVLHEFPVSNADSGEELIYTLARFKTQHLVTVCM
jgi:hypothetical protein